MERAFAGFIPLLIGAGVAYLIWPSGITDQTLASATIGALLRAGVSIVVAIWGFVAAVIIWSEN